MKKTAGALALLLFLSVHAAGCNFFSDRKVDSETRAVEDLDPQQFLALKYLKLMAEGNFDGARRCLDAACAREVFDSNGNPRDKAAVPSSHQITVRDDIRPKWSGRKISPGSSYKERVVVAQDAPGSVWLIAVGKKSDRSPWKIVGVERGKYGNQGKFSPPRFIVGDQLENPPLGVRSRKKRF